MRLLTRSSGAAGKKNAVLRTYVPGTKKRDVKKFWKANKN